MKVLYVEDDPASQRLVRKIVESEGMQIVVAENGIQAIGLLNVTFFDILILDLMIPGVDGIQVGRSARKESKNKAIPIIFVSAHPNALREFDVTWLGPVACITKPFRVERLLEALRKATPK